MFRIRGANSDDACALIELYTEHLTQYPPTEPQDIAKWTNLLKILIENPDYHLLVGEIDGKVISSVTFVVIKNLTHNLRPYAVMENLLHIWISEIKDTRLRSLKKQAKLRKTADAIK